MTSKDDQAIARAETAVHSQISIGSAHSLMNRSVIFAKEDKLKVEQSVKDVLVMSWITLVWAGPTSLDYWTFLPFPTPNLSFLRSSNMRRTHGAVSLTSASFIAS